ncbi:PRC-barrel domain-containing protein, partial [Agrococcus sp. HG114]|uniref:PRC-barrel domain-containing protein n=1 Tax=Agrococcus sp. HG114 TaxID=2969757 RepID=UPI00215A22BB
MEDIVTFQGNIDQLPGRDVYGSDGHRIGTVGQVFVMEGTDEPTWVTVQTGLFGLHESFVPVADATMRGDDLTVPYDKAFVKDAPRIDEASELTVDQEAELYRYYGVQPPLQQHHGDRDGSLGDRDRSWDDRDRSYGDHDRDRHDRLDDRGEVAGHLQGDSARHSGDADDAGRTSAHAPGTPYGGGHDAGSAVGDDRDRDWDRDRDRDRDQDRDRADSRGAGAGASLGAT